MKPQTIGPWQYLPGGEIATLGEHEERVVAYIPGDTSDEEGRLLAAAPDLLAALIALSGAVDSFVNGSADWPELDRARVVIARATGGAA